MRKAIIILIVCTSIPSFGHSGLIDSLKNQLEHVSNQEQRIDILNELAFAHMFADLKKSPTYLAEALELSRQNNYLKGEAKSYELRGILYRINGFYEECINDLNRSRILNDSIDYREGLASNYANFGLVFYELKNYNESIKYHLKSLELKRQVETFQNTLFTINDLCAAFVEVEKYDSAMYYSNIALKYSKSISDTSSIAFSHFNMAKISLLKGEFTLAKLNLDTAIDYCDISSNNFILMRAQLLKAKLELSSNQLDSALVSSNASLIISKKYNFTNYIGEAYEIQSKIFESKRDYESAYNSLKLANKINDSINDIKVERKTAFIAFQNEFEAKQKQVKEEFESNIFRQRVISISIMALLLFVLVVFAIVFLKNRQLRKAYSKLNNFNKNSIRQRNEIQQQKEKIQVQTEKLIHLNSTKDKIFSLVSHDLRGPIENLRSLLHLASNEDITKTDFQKFSATLEKRVVNTADNLNRILIWSRSQMGGLKSHPMNFNLTDAIEKKVELFKEDTESKGVKVNVDVKGDLWIYSDSDLISVVIRNLLSNAIKFTNSGDSISISAVEQENSVVLRVKDTGVGISNENIELLFETVEHFSLYGTKGEKGTGIGLTLVKEVVDILGGKIEVKSEIGMGSTFIFTIPNSTNAITQQ